MIGAVLPLPPPPTEPSAPAGWYEDPWRMAPWRWWNGAVWSAHTGAAKEAKPRLPNWVSPPVVLAAIPTVPGIAIYAVLAPLAIVLGLVPLLIVLPILAWLDRVEPEPWSSRIHAVLWGAAVAGFISVVVNSLVGFAAGEAIAGIVSAPLVEEGTKAAGLLWAVRRKELDGVVDGIVYAGWIGLGFAVVEDFAYFALAADQGVLFQTFVLRAILTPFAHPLFTAWTGLAVGMAVSKGKPVFPTALWGLALAVATHASWNGSLLLAEEVDQPWIVLVAMALFVALFVAAVVTVIKYRRVEQQHFSDAVPFLAHRYGLPAGDVEVFGSWAAMRSTRKALSRPQRKDFDKVHSTLARLAVLHSQPGEVDHAAEHVLNAQLQSARNKA
ncbi:MAG: PrsW family intramembrane metalloprotease [Acidimicrobiales bacterium]